MSAIEKIISWANDIPLWQGDAVRRILLFEELSSQDEEEIYLMMKDHLGLLNKNTVVPKPILPEMTGISGVIQQDVKIILKSITCVEHINAIPDGNELPIGHKGLTIIYGENATGKSGFARILKRACNARDKRDTVLKNIFTQTTKSKPKASFKIQVGDTDLFQQWEEGPLVLSPHLSSIAVFDSKCARVIIDEKNEFQYKPYGTHVFEDLTNLIEKLKARLNTEKPVPVKPIIPNIFPNTAGYKFYQNLGNQEDSIKSLSQFESFTKDEENKYQKLRELIDEYKKANIKNKILSLKNTISKYITLLRELRKLERFVAPKIIMKFNAAIESLLSAEKAQEIAQTALNSSDFPLQGVITEAWRQLFEAAERYSRTYAYPKEDFPYAAADARCVLCMQSLDNDAKIRMKKFKDFIKDEVGNNLRTYRDKIDGIRQTLEKHHARSENEISNQITELSLSNIQIANKFKEAYLLYSSWKDRIIESLESKKIIKHENYTKFDVRPVFQWVKGIKKDISELEKANDPEQYNEKLKEYNELSTKKVIFEQKENIKEYLLKLKTASKIQNCMDSLDTRGISTKGRDVISKECTPPLQKYLREELNFLLACGLDIRFKARGSKGITLHEVEIVGATMNESPSRILSEGEQKAVAIAGFFAELRLANNTYPIVFDDPVTSLDHKYRDKIAERIAKESLKRQVIVFTHDIAFLVELEKHLGRLENSFLNTITLCRNKNKPGNVIAGKPWHAMSVKDRLFYLEQQILHFSQLYQNNLSEYNKQAANWYELFRETWEAIIEEVVFNGAIRRFGSEVQTLRVKEVEVTDDDYRIIDIYMSKASEWMRGHDKAKALSIDRPSPNEIREDLTRAREFVKSIGAKRNEIRKRRNDRLRPQSAQIG